MEMPEELVSILKDVEELLADGKKIQAIKLIRAVSGVELKVAKDLVDNFYLLDVLELANEKEINEKLKEIADTDTDTDLFEIGEPKAHYNASCTKILKYSIDISHSGLNEHKTVSSPDTDSLGKKLELQLTKWSEKWEKIHAKKEGQKKKEESIELARDATNEAQESLEKIKTTLLASLDVDHVMNWNELLDHEEFSKVKPIQKEFKSKPTFKTLQIPTEPNLSDVKYQPKIGFFDKLFAKSKAKKIEEAQQKYDTNHKAWEVSKEKILQKNKDLETNHLTNVKNWKNEKLKHEEEHKKFLAEWETKKQEYELQRSENNKKIPDIKELYFNRDRKAVLFCIGKILENSSYPGYFPRKWDLDYQNEPKILIVDFSLPEINELPTVKEVKYVASRDDLTETNISKTELNKLYDDLLYQIALRTIHELFESDVVEMLDSIVFNGWVDSIDKATGQNTNSCIMSLQASKDEFMAINLEKIEPKSCFRQLKGVASSKLHGLSPVAPIIFIDKEDRRFVAAYDVADGVNEFDNLATMDWQDFENLIREIFEKEFISSGGEVKITQTSRDGGVDAIAFDPDPIRGGKIVIQAKRYTNVVGVSAVRDLYGTTMNEGATKGILVTTADYGPDAYAFAKGKPLTLLNGGNLLHLLEKHGHKAKIDLKEAKKFFAEQKTTS